MTYLQYVVGIIGQIKFSLFVHRDELISLKLYMRQEGVAEGRLCTSTSHFWLLSNCSQTKGSGPNSAVRDTVFTLGICCAVAPWNSGSSNLFRFRFVA